MALFCYSENMKKIVLTVMLAALAGSALAQVATPEVAAGAGIPTSVPSTQQMHNDQMMD